MENAEVELKRKNTTKIKDYVCKRSIKT